MTRQLSRAEQDARHRARLERRAQRAAREREEARWTASAGLTTLVLGGGALVGAVIGFASAALGLLSGELLDTAVGGILVAAFGGLFAAGVSLAAVQLQRRRLAALSGIVPGVAITLFLWDVLALAPVTARVVWVALTAISAIALVVPVWRSSFRLAPPAQAETARARRRWARRELQGTGYLWGYAFFALAGGAAAIVGGFLAHAAGVRPDPDAGFCAHILPDGRFVTCGETLGPLGGVFIGIIVAAVGLMMLGIASGTWWRTRRARLHLES